MNIEGFNTVRRKKWTAVTRNDPKYYSGYGTNRLVKYEKSISEIQVTIGSTKKGLANNLDRKILKLIRSYYPASQIKRTSSTNGNRNKIHDYPTFSTDANPVRLSKFLIDLEKLL